LVFFNNQVVRGRKGRRWPFPPSFREVDIEFIEEVVLDTMGFYDEADEPWDRGIP
jgi:hypothetical protein